MAPLADVEAALAELRTLQCSDPAARRAVAAVRLTCHTLEFFWVPTVTAHSGDDRYAAGDGDGR